MANQIYHIGYGGLGLIYKENNMIQIKKFESYGYNDGDVIEKANKWIKENHNKMHIIEVKNLVKESNYTCIILVYEELETLGVGKVKIEIPEQELMDYNPVKKYLKWEDLEFSKEYDTSFKVKLGDSIYTITCSTQKFNNNTKYVAIETGLITYFIEELNKQFFNDLHLERVEE